MASLAKEVQTKYAELFPGLEQAVEWKRELVTMVNGAELNVAQTAGRRPDIRARGPGGLYLIGDTVGAPGAGGEIAAASALSCFSMLAGQGHG